jgi:hypothetical protein
MPFGPHPSWVGCIMNTRSRLLSRERYFCGRQVSWLAGRSFAALLQELDVLGATYPYGSKRRKFDIDLVVDLCEQTFGFELPCFLLL